MAVVNIDVDGVLGKNIEMVCNYIEEEFGYVISKDEITEYDYYFDKLEMSFSEVIDHLYNNNPNYITEMDVIEGSVDALNKIHESGNYINIISHRRNKVKNETRRWLEENNYKFDSCYISSDLNKHEIPGDIMIDDAPHVAEGFRNNGTHITVFPRKYNKLILEYNYVGNPLKNISEPEKNQIINKNKQWEYVLGYINNKFKIMKH